MSTYLSLNYHLIFSTKQRQPLLATEWLDQLHQYLGGTVRGLGGVALRVGGTEDHVHLLVGLKATHCLADFMRDLKKQSSIWIRDQLHVAGFAWQEGYAAITVSPSGLPQVDHYIATQAEHHSKQNSRDELLELLKKVGIDFDPRYFE